MFSRCFILPAYFVWLQFLPYDPTSFKHWGGRGTFTGGPTQYYVTLNHLLSGGRNKPLFKTLSK